MGSSDRDSSDDDGGRRVPANRMGRLVIVGAAAVGAAGASFAAVTLADAGTTGSKAPATSEAATLEARPSGARPAAFGTVKSVGSDSFTLTTRAGGTVTVNVTSATKYGEPGKTTATLADVTVGKHVAVAGTTTGNTVAATSVFIGDNRGEDREGRWGGAVKPAAFGTVKSVAADSFTLTTRDGGTLTVNVTSATKYGEPGKTTATLADVTVGRHVAVLGTTTGNAVAATSVFIGDNRGEHRVGPWGGAVKPAAFGTVKSVAADSFTLTTRDGGTLTVNVTSATKYGEPGKTTATLADVTVDKHVAVAGTTTGNTVAATNVFIGGNRGFHGPRGRFGGYRMGFGARP